jgi:hypothetical protein
LLSSNCPVVEESREVRFAFPPKQRFVSAKRKEGYFDVHDMLACHGWPPRWAHRCDGASSDAQALRCPVLGMLWVVSAAFALQPQATKKSDFCGYVDWVGALLWGVVSFLRCFLAEFCCRFLLCGWTLSRTCTTMATTTSFPGTVER